MSENSVSGFTICAKVIRCKPEAPASWSLRGPLSSGVRLK